MNQARRGDWMQTYTGAQFWPLDPRVEDIHLEDISAALSKMCRYGGQCLRFYSVAEHCVHVASKAPPGLQLAALMHDASEAYLSDVIRPIKKHLTNYSEIESHLERVIAHRFGLPHPLPAQVKALDNGILWDEMQQNMTPPPQPWEKWLTDAPLGVKLQFWMPAQAAYKFTTAFYRYGGK